jgi:hypothetical protein
MNRKVVKIDELTYVLDGLMSSTFLWKECWVGVAADTETVDEL